MLSLGSEPSSRMPILANLIIPMRIEGNAIVHATHGPLDTSAWPKLWAIDFGIDHPFAAVLLAWDRDYDCVYVLAELKIIRRSAGDPCQSHEGYCGEFPGCVAA